MIVKFRLRRDTAANWTSTNPVLALGEPGLETDTQRWKFGDGVTVWASLPYARGAVAWGQITGTLSDQADLQSALNAKEPTIAAGTTAQYYRGDKTFQTLNAAAVGITAAALTKTDDTNVTLTLGGSPSTALLAAASLSLGWTGQLAVARGGTGASTSTGSGAVVLATSPTIASPTFSGTVQVGTNPGFGTLRVGAGAQALYVEGSSLSNGSWLSTFETGSVTGSAFPARYTGTTTGNLTLQLQQNGNGAGLVDIYGAGTGDVALRLGVSAGTTYWSAGIDNSDSDAFVIAGFSLGTGNGLRIDASTKAVTTYGALFVGSDTLRITTEKTPASATATGTKGDICWDASYLYICTATNTWRRIAHATW